MNTITVSRQRRRLAPVLPLLSVGLALLAAVHSAIAQGPAAEQNPTPPPVPGESAPPEGAPAADAPQAAVTPPAPPPGAKVDVIRERYPNGAIKIERHVVQNEKGDFVNHGPWTAFYPDGKKIGGGEMAMGARYGLWTRWFAPGEAMFGDDYYAGYEGPFTSEANFVAGKLDGPWVILDKHKNRISEWHFTAGVQNGPWIWRWPGGQLRREMVYVNGVIDGEVVEHAPDGKLLSKVVYIAGRKKELKTGYYGPKIKHWEGWYLNGKEKVKTNYDWWYGYAETVSLGYLTPPVKHGLWTWWHPNGQKWVQGHYVEGKQSGPWTWWTPEGKAEREKAFPVVKTKLVPTPQPGPPAAEPAETPAQPQPGQPASPASGTPAAAAGN